MTQSSPTTTPRSELRALVSIIRQSWSHQERECRRREAEQRQRWLLGAMQQAALQKQAS